MEKRIFYKIIIITNINSISIEKVTPLEAQNFVEFVNLKRTKTEANTAFENQSPYTKNKLTEQLNELKNLIELGYLSEEEFELKRRELLNL